MQGNEVLGTILKDASDPRSALTLADTRAQDIIWGGLRWGRGGAVESIRMEWRDAFGSKLTIVGEEDPPSKEVKVSALAEEKLPDDFIIPDDLQSLIVSDIIVS